MRPRWICRWRCRHRTQPSRLRGRWPTKLGRWTGYAETGEGRIESPRVLLRGSTVRLCVAAAIGPGPRPLRGDRTGRWCHAKPGARIGTDRRRRTGTGGPAPGGAVDRGAGADAGRGSGGDLSRARDDPRVHRQRCRHRLASSCFAARCTYPGRADPGHRRQVEGLSWRIGPSGWSSRIAGWPSTNSRPRWRSWMRSWRRWRARTYREPAGWLRRFRGIDTLPAVLLLAELHDVQRPPTARVLMAWRRGPVRDDGLGWAWCRGSTPAKTVWLIVSGRAPPRTPPRAVHEDGNTLARRRVVEAAWHQRRGTARRRSHRRPATERAAATGDGVGGRGTAAVVSPVPPAWPRNKPGSRRDGGRGAKADRLSLGPPCARSTRAP